MSYPDVLYRGEAFLAQYPRDSKLWEWASKATSLAVIASSKLFINLFYNPKLYHIERLENAMDNAIKENRGLMTVMNHMSVVDDPFVWGVLPFRLFNKMESFRWCLGASNICFQNKIFATFFSMGQVLGTGRFGKGPFQGSIDAAIRLLSPDDTMDLEYIPKSYENSSSNVKTTNNINTLFRKHINPVLRDKPSWVHVYPEGFVLQLQPPFNNSMRYFKWGITRLILESTKPPIIVPMFSTGFEKIAPESAANTIIERYLPRNFGAEIKVTIGQPINDEIIDAYRNEWKSLCDKYSDPKAPTDLSDELKYGKEAQDLRGRLAAELRRSLANIRHNECGFPEEDPRFKSPEWWKKYTATEGASDPEVQFIGENWAIRRLQKFLNEDEKK
ncbi:probable Lysophosphatidylcholine acyltransferase [Saccharomycodes ludwigii]|uniref:Tafazzin family protein n=1 Tax=Saccharomycodes ludwigii TaxID=36035 RepID=A0A376B4Q8_9ASCO|nr:hypothetical protein SCDLUD_002446 [Saccharomycodes ludwigii]KAH3900982.1 hypothetical protein SCDLUD_002446 [Saccharomycodes ludwigii]SSD59675.1 probable Lysophosphatidylcholine acyltransferase [Saccharomycodes ludwigii]